MAVAASGSDKFIVVWDPMEEAYIVSDLQTAIMTETENLYQSGGFDDFDDGFDGGVPMETLGAIKIWVPRWGHAFWRTDR